jgi:uncharacterized membrane protein YhaH (DUF805 family)
MPRVARITVCLIGALAYWAIAYIVIGLVLLALFFGQGPCSEHDCADLPDLPVHMVAIPWLIALVVFVPCALVCARWVARR